MSLIDNSDIQGFYVSMDYHNIAPDAIVSNYTVRWPLQPTHVTCPCTPRILQCLMHQLCQCL